MTIITKRYPYIALTYDCNLNCDYCASNGLYERNKKNISTKDFVLVIDWLLKQGVKSIALIGGEPTLHPKFNELMSYAGKKIAIFLPTNGLFGVRKRIPFSKQEIRGVTLHLNARVMYSENDWKLFNENAIYLSNLNILTNVGFVIKEVPLPREEILSFCQKHKTTLSLAFARPSAFGKNIFLTFNQIKKSFSLIEKDIIFFRERGIKTALLSNLPICLVKNHWSLFSYNSNDLPPNLGTCCSTLDGEFDASIVIHPNLTTSVCMALPLSNPKRIIQYKSLDEAKNFFANSFAKIQKQPLFKKCEMCELYNNSCHGGCLVRKL